MEDRKLSRTESPRGPAVGPDVTRSPALPVLAVCSADRSAADATFPAGNGAAFGSGELLEGIAGEPDAAPYSLPEIYN
jgi:hypothetical protein